MTTQRHPKDSPEGRLLAGLVALRLDPALAAPLLRYLGELVAWNKAYNLTAVREPAEMVTRHLLDSLVVLPFIGTGRVLDVGAGAGLPGIPLAIARPDLRVVLLDSNGKKARFLRHAVRIVQLANAEVVEQRVEDYQPQPGPDAVITRAFAALADFLRRTAHLPARRWLAMKGKLDTAELANMPPSMKLEATQPLAVPGLAEERHLVVVVPRMSRILAVTNQKGGVGKTTTAVNLAASLAATRRRVLLVDLDPQGNATMGLGVDKNAMAKTCRDVLLEAARIQDVILPLAQAGLSLIPANSDMTEAEVRLRDTPLGDFALRTALADVTEDFDYILLDCPPALSKLTVNALVAADGVLIPMQCEYYALEGLSALVDTVNKIRKVINPKLEIEGLLRTMYDPRNNLSNDVSAQLMQHFGEKVYRTIVPRNVRLAEAPSHGLPVMLYDSQSAGARAYIALAGEILRRHDGGQLRLA